MRSTHLNLAGALALRHQEMDLQLSPFGRRFFGYCPRMRRISVMIGEGVGLLFVRSVFIFLSG